MEQVPLCYNYITRVDYTPYNENILLGGLYMLGAKYMNEQIKYMNECNKRESRNKVLKIVGIAVVAITVSILTYKSKEEA